MVVTKIYIFLRCNIDCNVEEDPQKSLEVYFSAKEEHRFQMSEEVVLLLLMEAEAPFLPLQFPPVLAVNHKVQRLFENIKKKKKQKQLINTDHFVPWPFRFLFIDSVGRSPVGAFRGEIFLSRSQVLQFQSAVICLFRNFHFSPFIFFL